jgi:uncharacterized protein (DUF2237 family)
MSGALLPLRGQMHHWGTCAATHSNRRPRRRQHSRNGQRPRCLPTRCCSGFLFMGEPGGLHRVCAVLTWRCRYASKSTKTTLTEIAMPPPGFTPLPHQERLRACPLPASPQQAAKDIPGEKPVFLDNKHERTRQLPTIHAEASGDLSSYWGGYGFTRRGPITQSVLQDNRSRLIRYSPWVR